MSNKSFSEKLLLRKSFDWRGEISGKTHHLLSLRTDIPDQTRAVHNNTYKKLSVNVIVQQVSQSVVGIVNKSPGFRHSSSCVGFVDRSSTGTVSVCLSLCLPVCLSVCLSVSVPPSPCQHQRTFKYQVHTFYQVYQQDKT